MKKTKKRDLIFFKYITTLNSLHVSTAGLGL